MMRRRYNLVAIIVSLILSSAVYAAAAIVVHGLEAFQSYDPSSHKITAAGLKGKTSDEPRGVSAFALPDKTPGISGKTVEEARYDAGHRSTSAARSAGPSVKKISLLIPRASKEIFDYDISWLGIYAGNATLEAVDDNGLFKITSRVHSSPFVSVFYKVEDYARCLIRDGRPVNFWIRQHEGRYRSNKETVFDADTGNITFFNYLKNSKHKHTIKDRVAWDVMSGFYYLRTLPLEIGKSVYIDIFDSNKFYKAEVSVLRKEKIKVPDMGAVETILVKPVLKSEGLFRKKGDILVWLTDDERRIPVRVETKVPVGSVVAVLRNFKIK
jgi:hypothetical protein